MKILGIKGKNLASIKGEFNIEFDKEPLLSAGIFAITGPTGAGKSTILDAMCLALFGQTPRFNTNSAKENGVVLADGEGTIAQKDVKNILRKGETDGYAEVKFMAQDKQIYSSRWAVRRAKNQSNGALQADSIELRNVTTGLPFADKKTETKEEIVRLIGFSYDQFTRSVLLAQNDFTAFLKSTKNEKSIILEKLTGTEIYTKVSKLIYDKTKKATEEVVRIQNYLKDVKLLADEPLAAYQKEETEVQIQLQKLQQTKIELNKELAWHNALFKFNQDVSQAQFLYDQLKIEEKANEQRKATWNIIEKVQPARVLQETHQRLTIQLAENIRERDKLTAERTVIQADVEDQKNKHALLLNKSEDFEKYIQDNNELIKTAEAIDYQLTILQKQIKELQNEHNEAILSQNNASAAHQETLTKRKVLEKEIGDSEQFLLNNKSREPIAKNAILIVQKLIEAENAQEEIIKNKQSVELLETNIEQNQAILRTNQDCLLEHSDAFNSLKKIIQNKQKELNEVDIQFIKTEIETNKVKITNLKDARFTLQEANQLQDQINSLNNEILTHTNTIATLENARIIYQTEANRLKEKEKEAENAYQVALLASSENIISLRTQLVPNEACMVCGSTSHPYVTENKLLNHVLDALLANHQKHKDDYQESLNMLIGAQQKIKVLSDLLVNLTANQSQTLQNYELKQKQLDNIQFELNYTIKEVSFEHFIETSLAECNHLITKFNEQESRFYELQKLLEENKENFHKAQSTIAQLSAENAKLESNIVLEKESLLRIFENNTKAQSQVAQCINTVSQYFDKKDWKTTWLSDPSTFRTKIEQFAQKWQLNQELFEKNSKEIHTIDGSVNALYKNWQDKIDISQKVQEKLKVLLEEYESKLAQRKLLFDGKDLLLLQQEWKDTRSQLKEQLALLLQNMHQRDLEEERLTGSIKKIEEIFNDTTKELESVLVKIQQWLLDFNQSESLNLTIDEISKLLRHSQTWRENERLFFKNLDDQLLRALSTLDERKQQQAIHKESYTAAFNLADVQLELQKNEEELKNTLVRAQEISFHLKNDQEARIKSAKFISELDDLIKNQENLKKLNDMFGSSDGKKFSQMAQEYTLEILLNYANVHLKDLSNRYYLQRIPDTLALQVVDQDMGDEIRSVHTLSGGESFIVSLALALGLASLSTNRMSVESLFIDEGFGSLDADTLRVAMDTLERLQSQGRKVGVISHIPEMTERIHAQINVIRISEGTSKIAVAGL